MNYENGDVLLLSTEDGGDLNIEGGLIQMTGGFETAVYLSLFGGNDLDNGSPATKPFQFWGNLLDNNLMTSKTQNTLQGCAATPNNLRVVNEAILFDLNWLKEDKIADDIIINLSLPSKNRLQIEIEVRKNKISIFNTIYQQNWIAKSQKK